MKKILIIILILIFSLTSCRSNNVNNENNESNTENIESDIEEESTSSTTEDFLHDVTGFYAGFLDVNGTKLPMTLNLSYEESLTGYVDIEVQNTFGIEIQDVLVEGLHVSFMIELVSSKAYFDGEFSNELFTGDFTQNGMTFPFEFALSEVKEVNKNREELEFKVDDIVIKGEYIIPDVDEKMPVALIIAGSGPTDMNCNSSAGVYTNAYLYLAEALEKEGIATLRFNKRFLDNEVLSEADLSFEDFVNDAQALTEMLKADNRFSEVYIIGHSQGALIGKIVATRTKVDKVVSLAGAGRTIDNILIDQLSEQLTEEQMEEAKSILGKLKVGETVPDVPEILRSVLRESIQPFMISWINYDPQVLIKEIDSEVLIVVGGYDIQILVKEGEYLHEARPDAEYAVIETMNHVLKETTSNINDNYATYQNLDLPIHSELVDVIVNFYNK